MIFFKGFFDQGTLETGKLLRIIIGYILTPPPNCYIKREGVGAGSEFKGTVDVVLSDSLCIK